MMVDCPFWIDYFGSNLFSFYSFQLTFRIWKLDLRALSYGIRFPWFCMNFEIVVEITPNDFTRSHFNAFESFVFQISLQILLCFIAFNDHFGYTIALQDLLYGNQFHCFCRNSLDSKIFGNCSWNNL